MRPADLGLNRFVIVCRLILGLSVLVALLAIGSWAASHGLPGLFALVGAAWVVAALLWWARREPRSALARLFATAERVAGDAVLLAVLLALSAVAIVAATRWCLASPYGPYGVGTAVLLVFVLLLVDASERVGEPWEAERMTREAQREEMA
jgi:hypothetical protein